MDGLVLGLAALMELIAHVVVLFLWGVLRLTWIIGESLYIGLKQGQDAGFANYDRRLDEFQTKRDEKNSNVESLKTVPLTGIQWAVLSLAIVIPIVGVGILISVQHFKEQDRKNRIAATENSISSIANDYQSKLRGGDSFPRQTLLPKHDAWGKSIRATYHNLMTIRVVEVRSAGPDERFDTTDDIRVQVEHRLTIKDAAIDASKRTINKITDKLLDKFSKAIKRATPNEPSEASTTD